MTENRINPLLDAMSEIDDNIITNARTAKKSKKRPLLIAVAAAAALTVITGAAVVSNRFSFTYNGEKLMDLNMKVMGDVNTDPYDQLIEMGAAYSNLSSGDLYEVTARPSEVFEVLNFHPLINDNFTDEATEIRIMMTELIDPARMGFLYVYYDLYDKETGVNISLSSDCTLLEEAKFGKNWHTEGDIEPGVLDLNDGSKLMYLDDIMLGGDWLVFWQGGFCYDGISYSFHMCKPVYDPEIGEHCADLDYDTFVQTLDHLGIL